MRYFILQAKKMKWNISLKPKMSAFVEIVKIKDFTIARSVVRGP